MHWQRSLTVAAVAGLVTGALVWGFWPRPVLIDAVAVTRAPLRVSVEEEGRTRVKDRFVVSAPVAGYARRITVDVGDAIARGQVLGELEPLRPDVLDPRTRAEALARVAATEAALTVTREKEAAARADADYAERELDRVRLLYEADNASLDDLDEAHAGARRTAANLRSARFQVEVARFELEVARAALRFSAAREQPVEERVAINAPVDGRVLKVYRESEGVVRAGEALVEIGDPAALEVEVELLSADAVRVASGTPVRFERWGGDTVLEGQVRTVEPVGFTKISALGVEEQRVLVIADINSPPEQWQRLGDGYRLEASFVLWQDDDVLQIPTSALFRADSGWAAFVLSDGRAAQRRIEIGRRGSLQAQVLAGLSEGERVIVHPDDTIEDGVRVRAR